MGRLTDKVAFITGAARGQGRAHAVRLAAEGANIIAVDVNGPVSEYVTYPATEASDIDETVRLVQAEGRDILAKQADVRDLAALGAAVEEGVARFGRLDVVVANAGICNFGRVWELTETQWQEVIDINLGGVWKTLKVTVPKLIEQGRGGSVIITSSVAGLRGLPFLGHYDAAKHGLVGLAKALANEVGEHEIRVNTVHPHGVNTPMGNDPALGPTLDSAPKLGPIFMPALPKDVVEPEDIATMVAFLASDDAKYITGAEMKVDLGTLAR